MTTTSVGTGDAAALARVYYEAKNYKKAKEWWSKAAKQGDADAQLQLENMYRQGHAADDKLEIAALTKKAEAGDVEAQS